MNWSLNAFFQTFKANTQIEVVGAHGCKANGMPVNMPPAYIGLGLGEQLDLAQEQNSKFVKIHYRLAKGDMEAQTVPLSELQAFAPTDTLHYGTRYLGVFMNIGITAWELKPGEFTPERVGAFITKLKDKEEKGSEVVIMGYIPITKAEYEAWAKMEENQKENDDRDAK